MILPWTTPETVNVLPPEPKEITKLSEMPGPCPSKVLDPPVEQGAWSLTDTRSVKLFGVAAAHWQVPGEVWVAKTAPETL